jgi:hypothetical protein
MLRPVKDCQARACTIRIDPIAHPYKASICSWAASHATRPGVWQCSNEPDKAHELPESCIMVVAQQPRRRAQNRSAGNPEPATKLQTNLYHCCSPPEQSRRVPARSALHTAAAIKLLRSSAPLHPLSRAAQRRRGQPGKVALYGARSVTICLLPMPCVDIR